MSYIVRNLMTRPTHLSTYWVNIRGLFNPKHIDRVNKLMTNNLLLNSQNKSDLDETFTEPSDGYCFKPNHIKPNQLLIFSKPAKKKSDLDEIFTEASAECYLEQNQTKLTKSNTKFLA